MIGLSKMLNLQGKTFGDLKVIEYSGKKKASLWKCRCKCGKEIIVRGSSLTSGNTKSCGCSRNKLYDKRRKDLTGKRFGRLVAISYTTRKTKNGTEVLWRCRCDCGNEVTVTLGKLVSGHTKSCGCYRSDVCHSKKVIKNDRIYSIWTNMKQRCKNKNIINYKNYGARGISVCKEWDESFDLFYEWSMDNGYRDDLTLDRIDNDGDYCPENCRWVTYLVQQNNKRSNHYIKYKGEEKSLADWCRELDIPYQRTVDRIHRGWEAEKAFEEI